MHTTDSLAEELTARLDSWANNRDMDYRRRWDEYYRLWRGIWAPEDMERNSERSHVIMPTTQQAIESSVAEIEEAIFGRESWLQTGIPILDDLLIADFWRERSNISEAFLLGAIYGTCIGKISVIQDGNKRPVTSIQALDPAEFIVDPSAETIDDSMGLGHKFYLPRWIVERRMRDGLYRQITLDAASQSLQRRTGESQPIDSDYIELYEWHGLVPAAELEARERTDKLKDAAIGEDELVEAVCTVANGEHVLRCEVNELEDRPYVVAQWDTVPRRIWGRGIAEKVYWPQKALDSEMRSRIDALAYSVAPMMAVSSSQVPRSERFEVRPGRNIFMRGDVRTGMAPVGFPPPDPQTYNQSMELQRMIEVASGQPQVSNPLSGDVSRTTNANVSSVMAGTVKRSRKTVANISRDFIAPMVRKVALRMHALDPEMYPELVGTPKIVSGLGILQREFEVQQLSGLMQSLPDSPAKLELLRLIIEGSSITEKSRVMEAIDGFIEQLQNPQEEPPSPETEVQLLKLQEDKAEREARMQLETAKLRAQVNKDENAFKLSMLKLSLDTEVAESNMELNGAKVDKLEGESVND